MISWLKQPLIHTATIVRRMRFYVVALIFTAISVPFVHLYMRVELTIVEYIVHTLNIVFSVGVVIVILEILAWYYLRGKRQVWRMSVGVFWLLFFCIFLSMQIVMNTTHDLFPITVDIMDKHIEKGFEFADMPLKILPVALLAGVIIVLIIRKFNVEQELAELKKINDQMLDVHNKKLHGDVLGAERIVSSRFILKHEGQDVSLTPESIVRIEADENYCHLYIDSYQEHVEQHYMVRITLSEVLSQLSTRSFVQIHRSHIINLDYLENIEKQERNYYLKLTNGDKLPVSRQRIKSVRDSIQNYLLTKNNDSTKVSS